MLLQSGLAATPDGAAQGAVGTTGAAAAAAAAQDDDEYGGWSYDEACAFLVALKDPDDGGNDSDDDGELRFAEEHGSGSDSDDGSDGDSSSDASDTIRTRIRRQKIDRRVYDMVGRPFRRGAVPRMEKVRASVE